MRKLIRRLRARPFIALYLLATPVLGVLGLLFSPSKEVYPFFSWFLFALTPGPQTVYSLEILESRHEPLPSPLAYTEAAGWVPTPHAIAVRELTRRLALAVKNGDAETAARARRILERHHLYPGSVYAVVESFRDPLVEWREGKRTASERIAVFRSETSIH
ncbi:MAG: hypothetical protein NZM04_10365 [Methylacidiphilales bacterium]|nr:hypothetical protein [Candidatus Methylacidiphilales bacterium]